MTTQASTMLLLKLALEYNAAMIAHSAVLISQKDSKAIDRSLKQFEKITKEYMVEMDIIFARMREK